MSGDVCGGRHTVKTLKIIDELLADIESALLRHFGNGQIRIFQKIFGALHSHSEQGMANGLSRVLFIKLFEVIFIRSRIRGDVV